MDSTSSKTCSGLRTDFISSKTSSGLTLTVLGCGALGTAILSGLLSSRPSPNSPHTFTRFIACVRREEAAKTISATLPSHQNLHILTLEDLRGVQLADVIILACQPHLIHEVLAPLEIRLALEGKLIVSVLAGVSEADIRAVVGDTDCHIIRAMPNTACEVGESMTVIPKPESTIPKQMVEIADYIFQCVGVVRHIDPKLMDVCTTVCGSSPAFFAVILDALVQSAVAMGVRKGDALEMVAQAMKGTASLVLRAKRQPVEIRDGVTSPGGSTIVGVLKLEELGVRDALHKAVVATTEKAERLGRERGE